MGIEHLRAWHWAIIGIIVGALVGYVYLGGEPNGKRGAMLTDITNLVTRRGQNPDEPLIRNITIYPPLEGAYGKNVYPVYYEIRRVDRKTNKPAWEKQGINAEAPFVVYNPPFPARQWADIFEMLNQSKQRASFISYKYAWWHTPRNGAAIGAGIGLLAFGVVVPLGIAALASAGLAKKPERDTSFKLSAYTPGAPEEDAPVKAGPTAADHARLASVVDNYESNLAASLKNKHATVDELDEAIAHPEPEIKKLDGQPLEASPLTQAEKDEEERNFKGQYYPVSRKGKADH